MDIIDYAKQFVGLQETEGSNRGALVDKWKGEVSAVLKDQPIPWCACFCFAMLSEVSGLDRKGLAKALGFDPGEWYPESATSWLLQAQKAGRITNTPKRGDVFVLMSPSPAGGYRSNHAHHAGLLAQDGCAAVGSPVDTVEGNTVPGHLDGIASREGNGTYCRDRVVTRGGIVFISIPEELKTQTVQKIAAPPNEVATPAPKK